MEDKILKYKDMLENIDNTKKEIEKNLADNNLRLIIDFEKVNYKFKEIEDIFNFIIKIKNKNKIVALRNISNDNLSDIRYLQDLHDIEKMYEENDEEKNN